MHGAYTGVVAYIVRRGFVWTKFYLSGFGAVSEQSALGMHLKEVKCQGEETITWGEGVTIFGAA
jgi:hypothetical protein